MKVCFVAVIEASVKVFLVDHFKTMSPFFDISVCVNTKDKEFLRPFNVDATVIPMQIERKIAPLSDSGALLHLYRLIRKNKFDVVHSIMPKSGLLSMLAAFFARVPVRIHTFTGQVWATRKGFARWLLKSMDKLLAACATHVLVDSHSQRNFLIEQGVVSEGKSSVLANGSICGVDEKRFSPDIKARSEIRRKFAISESHIVFLFLGRLNRDKGLLDLARAFLKIAQQYENACLIIAGPDEGHMKEQILSICGPCSRMIHFEDFTDSPESYMAAADVFCLPSYREGFGIVVIEAASAGVPSIGSRIYGITDTIEDGVTGFLFSAGDPGDLALKMSAFIEDPALIKKMGKSAKARAEVLYSKEKVTSAMLDFYKRAARTAASA